MRTRENIENRMKIFNKEMEKIGTSNDSNNLLHMLKYIVCVMVCYALENWLWRIDFISVVCSIQKWANTIYCTSHNTFEYIITTTYNYGFCYTLYNSYCNNNNRKRKLHQIKLKIFIPNTGEKQGKNNHNIKKICLKKNREKLTK